MSKKEFDKLRKRGDYISLGNLFWHGFILLPEGKRRKALCKLWDSLTKKEQDWCE